MVVGQRTPGVRPGRAARQRRAVQRRNDPGSSRGRDAGEAFRQSAGTVVSDHPEGRFAAPGRLAAALVAEPPWHDYYGPGSPLERLVEAGGKVLRLGADLDSVTLTHYAEYLAPVPDKRRVRRYRLVTTAHGPQVRVVEAVDDSEGIVDHPDEDYFATILTYYLRTGPSRIGTVGTARSELIEATEFVEFAVEWMDPTLLSPAGPSGYHGCVAGPHADLG